MDNVAPIRSVSRSISVLQAINRYGSLSTMAIAKHQSLPYPTAYRIVQTLLHEGLIEQEPNRKHYRPTALVQSLAQGYETQGRLIDCAGPVIRALTREVGWAVFITERVGTRMVVRDATHAETSLTFGTCYPGFNLPLISSGTGQAWLSRLSDEEVDAAIKWHNMSPGLKMDERGAVDLKDRLARISEAGFCVKGCMNNEANRSASIAKPVLVDGKVVAVVTLIYFQAAMKEETAVATYLAPLSAAVREIEAELAAEMVN